MKPFETLRSVAASIAENDIDTDIIFPARFLLLLDKQGLGRNVFHERRANAPKGAPFVLDRPGFARAQIILAARNFGTGSSREQAVWALADFGIRVVIAESFGEIFHANCFKNGVLPIALPEAILTTLRPLAEAGIEFSVDLAAQTVTIDNVEPIPFDIAPYRKDALLRGLDEIGAMIEGDAADIAAFEARQRELTPWLYLTSDQLAYFHDLEKETALVR
ncbi:3-isopropylmalate dehydratase small subunit [Rhizobium sp. AQ_MP]|uniref:3-isopropylmalate dehydratase small subunit n=1 Tax=Rhizobium sp. AQ_MP TaxID=2761536 RepID=UPI0016395F37|nr:3-isopropylmalate dehydratase small subunit [Rhizobium sp. AQ_MP]MBC2774573.1 3-isopropylmalate dehydratase small subunit [Rhizobium sp. AQ_MP]